MATPRIKILFVLPSLFRAGAETQTVNLIKGMDSGRFKKYLLIFEHNKDLINDLDEGDVTFYQSERKHKLDITAALKIATIIDQEKIDLVHCTLQIALFIGWIGVKLSKKKPKLLLAVHTTFNRNRRNEIADKFLYQWMMRCCSKILFVCKTQEKYWKSRFPFINGRTVVIYNGVDVSYFDPDQTAGLTPSLRSNLNLPEHAKLISHIAAFRTEKGHQSLLNVFSKLLNDKEVYLIFVGEGELRPHIEKQVQETKMSKNIRFIGGVSDVRPYLSISSVSVIPSTAETFSMAMLESMAMQVPVIATDIGGAGEAIMHGKTGFLVPPNDADTFSRCIEEALRDTKKLAVLGEKAREVIISQFTREVMIEKTSNLIFDVMQER